MWDKSGPHYLVHTCPTVGFAVYSFGLPFADTRNQCFIGLVGRLQIRETSFIGLVCRLQIRETYISFSLSIVGTRNGLLVWFAS